MHQEWLYTVIWSTDKPNSFCHQRRNQWQAELPQTSCIFHQFSPYRSCVFTNASCLSPFGSINRPQPHPQPESGKNPGSHLRLLWLHSAKQPWLPLLWVYSGLDPSAVRVHAPALTSTRLHCSTQAQVETGQSRESLPTSRAPTVACGPRSCPVICHWPVLLCLPIVNLSNSAPALQWRRLCSHRTASQYPGTP